MTQMIFFSYMPPGIDQEHCITKLQGRWVNLIFLKSYEFGREYNDLRQILDFEHMNLLLVI